MLISSETGDFGLKLSGPKGLISWSRFKLLGLLPLLKEIHSSSFIKS
jgi:hypothetical protein